MARVLFFGKLADAAGARERELPIDTVAMTIADVIDVLMAEDEYLGRALREETVSCIVNQVMVSRDAAITNNDEIAFLPPVSGG